LIKNKQILKIIGEYDIDYESLCECVATACRKLYGVLEVDAIQDGEIFAFTIGQDKKLMQKRLKLTKSGMTKVIKESIKEIEAIQMGEDYVSKMLSYKTMLSLLEADILSISKKPVKFKILSTRKLYKQEQEKHPNLNLIIVVRADRFLEPGELRFFTTKSSLLKNGVLFVLD
jgi:hypothetical protein